MAVAVLEVNCKNCGAPLAVGDTACKYCKSPVTISTFNSVADTVVNNFARAYQRNLSVNPTDVSANRAIACCYLKLKMYDRALEFFDKAIMDNFDDSEVYFYAAICCLKGKRPYFAVRPDINKIEEYLNAATMIEPKGIYYYFWAYIKLDYYKKKFLNTTPDYASMLKKAAASGVSVYDKNQLFQILNVEKPSMF